MLVALARSVVLTPPVGGGSSAPPLLVTPSVDVGVVTTDMLDAAASTLKRVYSHLPSYDIIIPKLLEVNVSELPNHCHLTPGAACSTARGR